MQRNLKTDLKTKTVDRDSSRAKEDGTDDDVTRERKEEARASERERRRDENETGRCDERDSFRGSFWKVFVVQTRYKSEQRREIFIRESLERWTVGWKNAAMAHRSETESVQFFRQIERKFSMNILRRAIGA